MDDRTNTSRPPAPTSVRGYLALAALAVGAATACSDDIPVPAPRELEVKQVGFGNNPTVELSWRLVVRIDAYRLHYGTGDRDGPPYEGRGLSLVHWPAGCVTADLDAGGRWLAAADAGSPADADAPVDGGPVDGGPVDAGPVDGGPVDAGPVDGGPVDGGPVDAGPVELEPGRDADSPVVVPADDCLESVQTEAGPEPVHSPGRRPRIRLQRLEVGQTYHFAVQAGRRGALSALSDEVALTVTAEAP